MTLATRTIGFWLAVPLAMLQAVNAVRVAVDPIGFASYFGAPARTADSLAWVHVYGARAAFIALFVTILLARKNLEALKWAALAAVVMPLSDAWVAQAAGASAGTVGRHLVTAAYLIVAFVFLARADAQVGRPVRGT